MDVRIKRIYEPADPSDGTRVLVDRLWPRGVSKAAARLDAWAKEVAPNDELRRWFGHEPERWAEFRRRYRRELEARPEPLGRLLREVDPERPLTLLFGAKDEEHNQAVVLKEFLEEQGQEAILAAAGR